jgi:hypothetical protein
MFAFLVPETLWIAEGNVKDAKGDSTAIVKQQQPEEHQRSSSEEKEAANNLDTQTRTTDDRELGDFPPVSQVITHLDARTHTSGHCGMAWKPWAHPMDFLKATLAPIWMVSAAADCLARCCPF